MIKLWMIKFGIYLQNRLFGNRLDGKKTIFLWVSLDDFDEQIMVRAFSDNSVTYDANPGKDRAEKVTRYFLKKLITGRC